MFEELNKRRQAVAGNIAKSFDNDIEKALGAGYDPEGGDGDNVEKARQVGDAHPNGKWVWTEYKPGKFDWRPIKKKKEEEAPSGEKQSSEKTDDGNTNKLSQSAAKASDKALERASKDPKASEEVKAAATAEMEKRSPENGDNGGKKEITKESLQECSTDVQESRWGKYYSIQPQPIRVSGSNFDRRDKSNDQKEYLNLSIVGDKKSALKDIKSLNEKLGLNLDISQFERTPANRYHSNSYDIYYNPDTGTWGSQDEIWEEMRQYYTKDSSGNKDENKKRIAAATKGSNLTHQQISDIFDNDQAARESAFLYFNYDSEWAKEEGATKEQLAFCKKLEKLGARIAPKTFDSNDAVAAEKYKGEMQNKGYEMFDISNGDTFVWLAVKSNKIQTS